MTLPRFIRALAIPVIVLLGCRSQQSSDVAISRRLSVAASLATDTIILPRGEERTVNITSFRGSTYLQATLAAHDGIYDKTMIDDNSAVTVNTADNVVSLLASFDPAITNRTYGFFINGKDDFRSLVMGVEGKSYSPQTIRPAIPPLLTHLKTPSQHNLVTDACADLILLCSGSGTLVKLDANSYFYNVAYQNPIVKSGRSFADSSARSLLDPSDKYYLSEMGTCLTPSSGINASTFLDAILRILINCDTSGFDSLDSASKTVVSDFMAIYTAESIRHNMVNLDLSKDPWEIDIAEVTILSIYGSASGMAMQNGQLVEGGATMYYGQGASGGGIGETRADFTKLSQLIASYESIHHPDLIAAVVNVMPIQDAGIVGQLDGDVFRRIMFCLNQQSFGPFANQHADAIRVAVVALLNQIRTDSAAITQYVKANTN